MIKIRLADGAEYPVLENTAIYPGASNVRSRFEIHMAQDAMSVGEFTGLFTDESRTSEMHLVGDNTDVAYFDYCIAASAGLRRVTSTAVETGEPVVSVELVAELEQLTYIEKQLKALGINI